MLSEKELLAEVDKARNFKPKLSTFTVACTGPRNAVLQEKARLITQLHEQQGLFSVHVWYWDDILERLNDFPEVISLHFPHFRPAQTFSALQSNAPAGDARFGRAESAGDASAFLSFAQPAAGPRMLDRRPLARTVETVVKDESSVYLNAPSGYGKSVLLSQLRLTNAAWIDCRDDYRDFAQFRHHMRRFMRAKYPGGIIPEAPRELARALDKYTEDASEAPFLLALDHIDGIDNGVKAFLDELISSARNVRLVTP